jgi:hypothetical protein
MSLNPPSTAGPPRAIARAVGLLLNPCAEWERIDAETTTVPTLFRRLVLPLAAIGPLAIVFNGMMFGQRRLGLAGGATVLSIVLSAVIVYALSLVMTCLLALIIDGLAPGFCGCKNRVKAFKVAAYAGAAGWIAGVFGALPWLAPLMIVGFCFSIFLLYRGLPRLMRAPPDRALGYTTVTVGMTATFGVLVFVTLGSVAAAVSAAAGLNEPLFGFNAAAPVQTDRGPSDLAQFEAAARQAQLAANSAQGSSPSAQRNAPPIGPDQLEALLPAQLGDLPRTQVSGATDAAGNYSISHARAIYRDASAKVSLSVTDLQGASGLVALAGSLNLERAKTTANGFQRIGQVDGRLTAERYDRRKQRGALGMVFGNRYLVEVEGQGVSAAQLEAAAEAVDTSHLPIAPPAGGAP